MRFPLPLDYRCVRFFFFYWPFDYRYVSFCLPLNYRYVSFSCPATGMCDFPCPSTTGMCVYPCPATTGICIFPCPMTMYFIRTENLNIIRRYTHKLGLQQHFLLWRRCNAQLFNPRGRRQNNRYLSRATAVTLGWIKYRNNSQHRKLTMEKKIPSPLLPGLEPATCRSRARRCNH